MTDILTLKGVSKTFHQGHKSLQILDQVDLSLSDKTITALVGKSGAGKSTLLQITGLLDQLDSGTILIKGQDVSRLSADGRADVRSRNIGFVYQAHHLMPDFTAIENAMMPMLIQGQGRKLAYEKAAMTLERLGLADRFEHRPSQLSGGEQQRVAIARALSHGPDILLADEPTGNLDESTSERVMDLLLEVVKENGIAAFIATHDRKLAASMDKTMELSHGKLTAV